MKKITIPIFTTMAVVSMIIGGISGAISPKDLVLLSFLGYVIHGVVKAIANENK